MAADPYYTSVVALLHCDGADASTTFTDNGPSPKTFTASGAAQVDTAQSKFGGASLLLDGSSDYVSTPVSSDFAFGTGDFTIEFWARKSANGAGGYDVALTTDTSNGSAVSGWFLELSSSRGFQFWHSSTQVISYSTNPNDSTWHHWAVTRGSGTVRVFKDGTQVATSTYSTAIVAAGSFGIGGSVNSTSYRFAGHIDDLRITKGVARYTAGFSVPTEAFPNYATYITGTVKDSSGANCSRTVRAYRRDTGALLTETTSNATTGAYTLYVIDTECQVVVLDDVSGTVYNDLIARVNPTT